MRQELYSKRDVFVFLSLSSSQLNITAWHAYLLPLSLWPLGTSLPNNHSSDYTYFQKRYWNKGKILQNPQPGLEAFI